MPNQIITKDIDRLEVTATRPFNMERIAADLERVKASIKEVKTLYQEAKENLSQSEYSDQEKEIYYKELIKLFADIVGPSYQNDLDITKQELESSNVRLATLFDIHIRITKRIGTLKRRVIILEKKLEEYTEEAFDVLSYNIEAMHEEITNEQKRLRNVAIKIGIETRKKSDLVIEIANLKRYIQEVKGNITGFRAEIKEEKFIDPLKSIDEAEVLTLKRKLDRLEEEKGLLETDPVVLSNEIRELLKSDSDKDAIKQKYEMLSLLASGTKMYQASSKVGYKTISYEPNLGELKQDKEVNEANLLYSERAMAAKNSQANAISANITSCYEVASQLQIIANELAAALENEKDASLVSSYRADKKECEALIKEIEAQIKDMTKLLENALSYNSEEIERQSTIQHAINTTERRISEIESGLNESSTVKDRLTMLSGIATMIKINGEMIMPLEQEEIIEAIEDLDEDKGLVTDLAGETYDLPADPNTLVTPSMNPSEEILEASPRIVDIPKPQITREDGLWRAPDDTDLDDTLKEVPAPEENIKEEVVEVPDFWKIPEIPSTPTEEVESPEINEPAMPVVNQEGSYVPEQNESTMPAEIVDLGDLGEGTAWQAPSEEPEVLAPIEELVTYTTTPSGVKIIDIRRTEVSDMNALTKIGLDKLKQNLQQQNTTGMVM